MDSYQKFISEKAKYKRKILGKMFLPRQPVLLIESGIRSQESRILKDLLNGISSIRLTALVIGEKMDLPEAKNIHWLPETERSDAYKASDFVIILNNNVAAVLDKGCVPIAQLDGNGTVDYNPLLEKGNGFYFENPTAWEIFAAVVRGLETYKFPYDWENLVREIIK